MKWSTWSPLISSLTLKDSMIHVWTFLFACLKVDFFTDNNDISEHSLMAAKEVSSESGIF